MRLLEAIRILGLEKKTRFYQASTSELYSRVQEIPKSLFGLIPAIFDLLKERLLQPDASSHVGASQLPHADLPAEAQAIADKIKNDLQRLRNAPLPLADDLPPLTQKQLDRIAAFTQREDR